MKIAMPAEVRRGLTTLQSIGQRYLAEFRDEHGQALSEHDPERDTNLRAAIAWIETAITGRK